MAEATLRTKAPARTKGASRVAPTDEWVNVADSAAEQKHRDQFIAMFHKHLSKLNTRQVFVTVYKADPIQQVDLIKSGVTAEAPGKLATTLHLTADQLYKHLGFARATVDRKARNKENLSQDQSERIIGLMKLIGQVQTMVDESGDAEGFDAAQWVGEWIQKPNPALGKRRPADLMDTVQGLEIVSNLLLKMQTGAYA
ncbi:MULTISPECIES: type II RES/Xre toxin-antitoxin system antitoxin [Cupriavidus]